MEENLSDLIARKEKELQEISKLRLIQLEDQIRQKNLQIDSLTNKLQSIQEDFNYNVKLIDDRDAELHELESKYSSLQKTQKLKDCEISELRAIVASTEQRLKQESNKIKSQERVISDSRDQLREELTELKWKKEEEARKFNKIIDDLEKQNNRIVRGKEIEVNEVRQVLSLQFERTLELEREKFLIEKQEMMNEIQEKDEKIRVLGKDRKELQDKLQKIVQDDLVNRLENEHFDQIREKNLVISEKDIQINKLIDHSNHLAQQLETIKTQLEAETDFYSAQKETYEKEIVKLRNLSKQESDFLKESHEIQIQRLNSTFTSQINRLQQRLLQAEEESERNYLQTQQMREKFLNTEKKSLNEVSKVEDSYKKDLENAEEALKSAKQMLLAKDSELRSLGESLASYKARAEQYQEESKRLRGDLQVYEIEIESLKNEVKSIKASNNAGEAEILRNLRIEYEKQLKEMSAAQQPREKINKLDNFPRIWSEDLGPASSIKSSNNEIMAENEELKRIIEEMRQEIEFINQQAGDAQDVDRLRETVAKLRNEVIRVSTERDQLLEISSELKAELRMLGHGRSVQVVDSNLIEKIEEMQEGLRDKEARAEIPCYEQFEDIANVRPVRDAAERNERNEKAERDRARAVSNSERQTASQKEVHERIRATLKKTKKPVVRNYNVKE